MQSMDRSYSELNLNEIAESSAYAHFVLDSLENGGLSDFETDLFDDAIKVCETLNDGLIATRDESIGVSQLGPYSIVKPLAEVSENMPVLEKSEEVLNLLMKVKENDYSNVLTEIEFNFMKDFFTEISEKYLHLATTIINVGIYTP